MQNISAMALLLVFLISSSGFTIATHYCSGSKKSTQSIGAGFAGNQNGCGVMSCSVSGKNLQPSSVEGINKSKCCKENITFYKITALYHDLNNKPPIVFLVQNSIFQDIYHPSLSSTHNPNRAFLRERYCPSPRAGKKLILYLQQIRIPSPASVS